MRERRRLRLAEIRRRAAETDALLAEGPNPLWEARPMDPSRLPSSSSEPVAGVVDDSDDEEGDVGPERVRGEMVWLHKTAPILQISGKRPLTPEEISSGRRR